MSTETSNQGAVLFLYAETPLHVGAGSDLGAVDLPLQRERMSGLPMVQGSGLKGAWRETAREWAGKDSERRAVVGDLFGPEPPVKGEGDAQANGEPTATQEPESWAGAAAFRDARLLLLPLRAVHGGWAWATSPMVLQRLARDLSLFGVAPPSWAWLTPRTEECAVVGPNCEVAKEGWLGIEDFAYDAEANDLVKELAAFLAQALPATPAYQWFRERLAGQLVILADEELRHLAQTATEVTIRVRMDRETGTVEQGGLWSEESFPAESLLWTLVAVSDARRKRNGTPHKAADLAQSFCDIAESRTRIRLGGDQTVGRGVIGVNAWKGGTP
jgi:CRISPR-associated protein Cmr4